MEVVIVFQSNSVSLMKKGEAEKIHLSSFPPLVDLLKIFIEQNGKLLVCSPCLKERKIVPEDLNPGAVIIASGTLVKELSEADKVISY